MDIGTAKPSAEVLAQFPHRLVDILDPAESYSAAEFSSDALAAMAEITAAGRIPLLVGGTMLYFKALQEGLADMPAADASVRGTRSPGSKRGAAGAATGWRRWTRSRLHAFIPTIRSGWCARWRSIVSAATMSEHRARQRSQSRPDAPGSGVLPYTVAQLCIAPAQRHILHERIERRFRHMVEQGFVEEVEALRSRGDLHLGMPSIRAVGYRQVWEYLDGSSTREEMVERGIIATGNWPSVSSPGCEAGEVHWLDSLSCDNLPRALKYLQSLSILS